MVRTRRTGPTSRPLVVAGSSPVCALAFLLALAGPAVSEPQVADQTPRESLEARQELDASLTEALDRAQRSFESGELEDALRQYELVAVQYPDSRSRGVIAFNIGIVLRDLGRCREAIPAFERLVALEVDNREPVGDTIMQMNYRNYHFRSAVNISWCYEQLGDYGSAYRWIEMARTTYPYEGWCGVEINSASRFVSLTADRISLTAGGGLAARRVAGAAARSWFAWLTWATWCTVAAWAARRLPDRRGCVAYSAVPVALAVAVAQVSSEQAIFGDPLSWFLELWLLRWLVPAIFLFAALLLRTTKPVVAAHALALSFAGAVFGHAAWLYSIHGSALNIRLTLHELQSIFFVGIAPVLATVMSAAIATARSIKEGRHGREIYAAPSR